jgi:hypothetical protein
VRETVSHGREAGQHGKAPVAAEARGRRGRRRWTALAIVAVVTAGAVMAWRAGMFAPAAPPESAGRGAPAPATQQVVREDIAATTPVTATLGYAGSYTVTGHGGGTLTWLPPAGRVVRQGQVLYETGNGSPVVLLYGSVPDWRALNGGVTGHDVSQLNHDLVDLGDADRADIAAAGWGNYSWETVNGVQKLEEHLGIPSPSGSLPLGQVVFEPEAIRVSQVTGSLGGLAAGPVLKATSNRHVVTVPLDVSDQSEVKAGDTVTVALPDGSTTPGAVSAVGKIATTSGGPGGSTTIPVYVTLSRPSAARGLDQAPVTVNITTASVRNALTVPVTALLARSSGGYAVEIAGPANTRRWVPVTPGIYDGADGQVQVTGALRPGQHVVVAAS